MPLSPDAARKRCQPGGGILPTGNGQDTCGQAAVLHLEDESELLAVKVNTMRAIAGCKHLVGHDILQTTRQICSHMSAITSI